MYKNDEERERPDWTLLILSAALLVAMGLATLYGLRYGNVDESVMVGEVSIIDGQNLLFSMRADEQKNVEICYNGLKLKGTLHLDGAEKDTILYRVAVKEAEPDLEEGHATPGQAERVDGWLSWAENSKLDPADVIMLVRVPRSGLSGDYVGPWMMYFVYQPEEDITSGWMFLHEDGVALTGVGGIGNPMTAMREDLEKKTEETTWSVDGHVITIDRPVEEEEVA